MGNIAISTINKAIADTLALATGIPYVQSYGDFTESIQDTPMLRVYATGGNQDPMTQTDRTTFTGGVKQSNMVFQADLYATQRSHVGEDMETLIPWIDKIYDALEAQKAPLFGIAVLRGMWWNWAGIIFTYGRPEQRYVGARFTINIRIF